MTDKNPHKMFSRAWLAWNGRKGGKAGRGAVKAHRGQYKGQSEVPPTPQAIPGPVTTGD